MKRIIRLTALLLALVMVVGIVAGCKKNAGGGAGGGAANAVTVEFSDEYTLSPLYGGIKDKNYFMHNPDRGFRTDLVIYVDKLTQYANDEAELQKAIRSEFNIYFGGLQEPCHLAFAYIYLTKWHLEELPDDALTVIEGIFEYCRLKNYKLYVCFCYNNQYAINCHLSQENKDKLASECADQETILKHIDQLAPIIAEYKDCCFNIKNGFIGFVGEWARSFQWPEVDYNVITKAIVDKLCAPNEIYFSHRLPEYTADVKKAYPDWENIKWIGFNNCAFYGEQSNEGWNSAGFQVNDKDGWWEYMCENGAYAPTSGEMFTSENLNSRGCILKGKEAILEMAHHWQSVFSFFHGKYDCVSRSDLIAIMDNWAREEINKEWLDAQGIIYDPNWFVDANGNPVARNCYEFIRDHLGYKIVADNVKIDAANGKITVSMGFKNYGFSAAFNLKSGFAILNDKFEMVSEVEVGDPSKWYSHDPENWKSNEVLSYSLSAELDAPTESGTYYVAFFLRNTMGMGAQLSNTVDFQNNYNILYSF